jgi:hypothetical protein
MATLNYEDYQGSGANSTSYTFSSMGIGTADADRKVLAVFATFDTATIVVSSVTIGGVSASLVASNVFSDTERGIYVYEASVPTGTTADVVVNFTATQITVACATYSAIGLSMTPDNTDSDEGSSSSSLSATVTRVNGGAVLAVGWSIFASDISWTGVTEDLAPQFPEGDRIFSTASLASVGTSSLAITETLTGSANDDLLLAVSFAPDGTAYPLPTSVGTFTLTGIDTDFNLARVLTVSTGAFTLTGFDAVLTKGTAPAILTAETGEFILTGLNVGLSGPSRWRSEAKNDATFNAITKNDAVWRGIESK